MLSLKKPTKWSIQKLLEDKKLMGAGKTAWMDCSCNRAYISLTSVEHELKNEVKWFKSSLSKLLDRHAKTLYITPFSKGWWNNIVAKIKKIWAWVQKFYGKDLRYKNQFKEAQNTYYQVIRKAKPICWQNFLQQNNVNQKAQLDRNWC